MKQKTLEYVSTIESACAIARSLPICCSTASPEWPFVRDLWKARDRFIENLTAGLPEYEIPATASLLAKAQSWPDCEGAYRLPDNRLLVCWVDFTEPEVLTEAEYLSKLAHRCVEIASDDENLREEVIAFMRSKLSNREGGI